jgi:hypothetical protein
LASKHSLSASKPVFAFEFAFHGVECISTLMHSTIACKYVLYYDTVAYEYAGRRLNLQVGLHS